MKTILTVLALSLFLGSQFAHAQKKSSLSAAPAPAPALTNTSEHHIDLDTIDRVPNPLVWLGLNTAPLGAGIAVGTPVVPLELGIRVTDGLSIGPMATFSGTYRYEEADFKLSGFGVQAMYNFGRRAISDGFYVQGFFQRYSLSATKMQTVKSEYGGGFPMPLMGSIPLNSFGGGLGYQWVWKSGLRIAAGVKVAYIASDASSLDIMGASGDQMAMAGQMGAMAGSQFGETIDIPMIQDRSAILPMPEISVGIAL